MKKILRIVETVFNGNRSWRVYAEQDGRPFTYESRENFGKDDSAWIAALPDLPPDDSTTEAADVPIVSEEVVNELLRLKSDVIAYLLANPKCSFEDCMKRFAPKFLNPISVFSRYVEIAHARGFLEEPTFEALRDWTETKTDEELAAL